MTTTTLNASTTGFAPAETGLFDRLIGTLRRYHAYRQTRHALEALPIEVLDDLGLAGTDLDKIARKAAFH